MTILSQRIRLDLNNVQTSWIERCAGASRFVFNLGLARWQEIYEAGGKPNWRTINAEVNARKNTDLNWLKKIPWAIPNNALRDLNNAFQHFFRRVKGSDSKPGYPNFKSKKRTKPAFALEGRAVQFSDKRVKLPKLGWIKTRQELRFPGKILSARFTKYADHWYISVQIEVEASWVYPHRCETQAVCGVDLGVVDLAVISDGTRVPAPRILRRLEGKLRMLNKRLSRRTKGGKNWLKAKDQLARLHERIANIRKDVTNNLTARLVRDFRWIGIEDLNVRGMAANHCLAKSVMDAAMSEVGRQILYKATLAGSKVAIADRWYPSSKTCSDCGAIFAGLKLGVDNWVCESCGSVHDRDGNASINLRNIALAQRDGACRQGSAGSDLRIGTKLPLGQELSSYVNREVHG
uniref:Putative transposase n=1 Tax=viral metagenome TaxID=1070528 RepID=A0A6H1Z996_9ZZZZ